MECLTLANWRNNKWNTAFFKKSGIGYSVVASMNGASGNQDGKAHPFKKENAQNVA